MKNNNKIIEDLYYILFFKYNTNKNQSEIKELVDFILSKNPKYIHFIEDQIRLSREPSSIITQNTFITSTMKNFFKESFRYLKFKKAQRYINTIKNG